MERGCQRSGHSRSPTFSRWAYDEVELRAVFRDITLSELALLPIHCDPDTDRFAWTSTAQLAIRHRLTMYDAAYLDLAKRRNLSLATLDQELRAAAFAKELACSVYRETSGPTCLRVPGSPTPPASTKALA